MKKRKAVGIFAAMACLVFFPAMATAKNGFLVAPGRLQIDVDQLKTHSFIITNTGDDPVRLSIEPVYLTIDDPTLNAGTHLSPEVADTENIVDHIRLSPRRVILKPGQRRDVRVQIRPLTNKNPGDYRAHLLVKMEENAYTVTSRSESSQGMGMDLDIKMETAVALYGRKGIPEVDLGMTCTLSPDGAAQLSITNPTAWRFEGRLLSEHFPNTPMVVLRESVRSKAFNIPATVNQPVFEMADLDGKIVSKAVCTED